MQDLKNLYSISSNTTTASNKATYIEAGIHKNIELKEIKKGVAKNGSDFIAIYFENETGDKLSYTEFPLKFNKALEEMNEEDLSKALRRIGYQMARWRQICEVFKPFTPTTELTANDFSGFIDNIIKFIGDSYKGIKLRVKVVYDDRNYTTFDSNPNVTFIENMSKVSDEQSKIRILPGDKMKRILPDVEKKEVNEVESIVENTAIEKDKRDDLPF